MFCGLLIDYLWGIPMFCLTGVLNVWGMTIRVICLMLDNWFWMLGFWIAHGSACDLLLGLVGAYVNSVVIAWSFVCVGCCV